jgi:hypothetical protein
MNLHVKGVRQDQIERGIKKSTVNFFFDEMSTMALLKCATRRWKIHGDINSDDLMPLLSVRLGSRLCHMILL